MPRPRITRPLALFALAATALALAAPPAFAASANVTIDEFKFQPATVTITVGDTVTWTNDQADVPHTATAKTGATFDSGSLATGDTYSETFDTAGTISYFCKIHPNMTGTIVVEAAAASTEPTASAEPSGSAAPTGSVAPSADATQTAPPTDTAAGTQGQGGGAPLPLLLGLGITAFVAALVARRRLGPIGAARQ